MRGGAGGGHNGALAMQVAPVVVANHAYGGQDEQLPIASKTNKRNVQASNQNSYSSNKARPNEKLSHSNPPVPAVSQS